MYTRPLPSGRRFEEGERWPDSAQAPTATKRQEPCSVRHVRSRAKIASSAVKNVSSVTGYVSYLLPRGRRICLRNCPSLSLKLIRVLESDHASPPQSEHKKEHKATSNPLSNFFTPKVISEPDPATGQYNPFPTFPYTGTLRPAYPLSPRREVPEHIPRPDYSKDGVPRSEQVFVGRNKITILDKAQQEGMRKVCRLAREVLDIAAAAAKPGVTTDFIDEVVHKACIERDVRDPPLHPY